MQTDTVTAQQVIDLVMTLPPDQLTTVYEFVLSIKERLPTSEAEREYQSLPDQAGAVARDAAAEYRVERPDAVDFAAFAPAPEGTHKPRPVSVRALPGYKLWLKYSDGVEGVVDLSHLVGKGVFAFWDDYAAFQKVHIGEHGEIAWNDKVDLCPDSMYMKITGLKPEELFPGLRAEPAHA